MRRLRAMSQLARRWWAALLLLVLALLAAGRSINLSSLPFTSDETWTRVHRQGVLRVGTDASYPPLASLSNDGTFVGLDVDLARAIAEAMNVDLELANIHWDGLLGALQAGRIDMIISAMPYDGTLTRDVAFSTAYADLGLVLVASVENSQPDDWASARVAVELGSEAHLYVRRLGQERAPVRLVIVDHVDDLLTPLIEGSADVAICDRITGGQLAADSRLKMILPPLVSEPVYVVTARDAPRLIAEVDSIIANLVATDELQMMNHRWLGGEE